MRLAYLYSRYPVLSQTFCDTEMLELERRGLPLLIGAIHSPLTSIRHGHTAALRSPVCYAPPQPILRVWEEQAKADGSWPAELIAVHDQKYGAKFKASTRARNALYFAELFTGRGIDRFHVHFANRAAHTALFVKALSGIPFSVTAHGQDFMSDLGSDELLREICAAAEFVAVETDYSRGLLAGKCPESSAKIHRVFNGMELSNFAATSARTVGDGVMRIASIGRLVPFKGFNYLIAACVDLRARGIQFICEIVGDGPLRDTLQTQIAQLQLEREVTLAGALSQEEVRERLSSCDVFALAAIVDDAGASDVFPTVILEAMASAKPVVSTVLAGIPESVVHGETGLLVPPRDSAALADVLVRFAENPAMREAFGSAGRCRVETHFQVSQTVEPLLELQQRVSAKLPLGVEPAARGKAAYLLDRWPDKSLPHLASELRILRELEVPVTVFVCEYDDAFRLTSAQKQLATELVFLPDEMVIEAEWQTHRAAARQLEDQRANAPHRAPAALFLREARYAIAIQRRLSENGITHVHATSAPALLCATLLRVLTGVTISATTAAADSEMSRELINDCLCQCSGGRVGNAKQLAGLTSSFMLDPLQPSGLASKVVGLTRRELADTHPAWQQWADQLRRWSTGSSANAIT